MDKKRRFYLLKIAPMPHHRTCFYIEGKDEYCNKSFSYDLARTLADVEEIRKDSEIFFEVETGTRFKNYDGQPVIIWNNFSAKTLLKQLGYSGFLSVFDPFPPNCRLEKNVRLTHCINIVNSFQTWSEFVNELTVNDIEFTQGCRRFAIRLKLNNDGYDIFTNYDTKNYAKYTKLNFKYNV